MEGFKLLSDGFKKLVEDGQCNAKDFAKEIKTLEFLGTCNNEETCLLFNSRAVYDIMLGIVSEAIRNTELQEKEEISKHVIREVKSIFDMKAKDTKIDIADKQETAQIRVNSRQEAWEKATRIFHTDYVQDEVLSKIEGFPAYASSKAYNECFCAVQLVDYNNRLKLSDGTKTYNIWIEDVFTQRKKMRATVRSITQEFKAYTIENLGSVQYAAGNLIITYLEDDIVKSTIYPNSSTVIVEIQ